MKRHLYILPFLLAIVVAGCDFLGTSLPGSRSPFVMQTDRDVYHVRLTSSTPATIEVSIPFHYHNQGPSTQYVSGCIGPSPPELERFEPRLNRWETAYLPLVPLCLSVPVPFEPGETLRDTLHVLATLDDDARLVPAFRTPTTGVFRLKNTAVDTQDIPLYSNPFEFRLPPERR